MYFEFVLKMEVKYMTTGEKKWRYKFVRFLNRMNSLKLKIDCDVKGVYTVNQTLNNTTVLSNKPTEDIVWNHKKFNPERSRRKRNQGAKYLTMV